MAKELALIGCGNMGSAIAKGVVSSGLVAPEDVVVADVSEASQKRLASELGCMGTCDNVEAVSGAKMVLIAVKPQYLDDAVSAFAHAVDEGAIVVSIAAGVSLERLEGLLGTGRKIVRVMPNLAATVLAAMSSLSPNANVSEDETAQVKRIFDALGRAEVVPEHLIDAVIAASGSSRAPCHSSRARKSSE